MKFKRKLRAEAEYILGGPINKRDKMIELFLKIIKEDSEKNTEESNLDFIINNIILKWISQPFEKRRIYQVNSWNDLFEVFQDDLDSIINNEEEDIDDVLVVELDEKHQIFINHPQEATEVWIYKDIVVFFDGHLSRVHVIQDKNFGKITRRLISDPNLSFLRKENDEEIKYDISKLNKIKSSMQKKKLVKQWNNITISVNRQVIKKEVLNPLDLSTREAVVIERKPHYRKLRNGKMHYFVGVKATYYKNKDEEKIGSLVNIKNILKGE